MWPGTFSLAAERCPKGGTVMFAFFALAGDLGCAGGPGLVGLLSGTGSGGLKSGLLFAAIFPIVLLGSVRALRQLAEGEEKEKAYL